MLLVEPTGENVRALLDWAGSAPSEVEPRTLYGRLKLVEALLGWDEEEDEDVSETRQVVVEASEMRDSVAAVFDSAHHGLSRTIPMGYTYVLFVMEERDAADDADDGPIERMSTNCVDADDLLLFLDQIRASVLAEKAKSKR